MPTGTMQTYPLSQGSASGYLVKPAGPGPFGAVVVIQEWWGLDDHIKSIADRLADAGLLAFAPDLYHGAVTAEPDEARKLIMQLNIEHAVAELVAATNYLCGRSDVQSIGVTGFCVGGSLALALAAATPRIGPVASFYGGRPIPADQLRQIGGPVWAFFGAEDQSIPEEQRQYLADILREQHVAHEIIVYPGVGHAFMNDSRPHGYDAAAAHDAWQRMLSLFRQYLEQA